MFGCAALALTGCQEQVPKGQVVASANGEEITVAELQAELDTRAPQDASDASAQAEVLRDVVDRKLWAQEARRQKLDQQIQFILARRRAEEAMLAGWQIRAIGNGVQPPSEAEIDQFLRKSPTAFASRTIFEIDQINVQPGGDPALAQRVAKAKSLGEVQGILTSLGIVGQRSRTEWNSMFMPASLAARLRQLSPDRLFFHRNGETLIAANVIAKTDVPLGEFDRKLLARESLTQQRMNAAVARRAEELGGSAIIRLQPGYALAPPALIP